MGLTQTNALIAISISGGPPANQLPNAILSVPAGATVGFSLQSIALVQRWEINISCDDLTLNGLQLVWLPGMNNSLTLTAPAAPYNMTYQSLVSDSSSSTAFLTGKITSTGQATATVLPTFFANLTNILPSATRQIVFTDGYSTVGDGGGGTWAWNLGTFTSDGGTIVVPTGQAGVGAWVRQYTGPMHARWFGALGKYASFDRAPLQAFLNAVGQGGSFGQLGIGYIDPGTYLVEGPIYPLKGQTIYSDNAASCVLRSDGTSLDSPFGFETQNPVLMLIPQPANLPTLTFSIRNGLTFYQFGNAGAHLNIGKHLCVSFDGLAQFGCEFTANLEGQSISASLVMVGAMGRATTHSQATSCFAVQVSTGSGGNMTLRVNLRTISNIATTTNDPVLGVGSMIGGQITAVNAVPSTGDFNVKVDYDGSFLRLYVNGVFISHLAMTGTVVQNWWDTPVYGGCFPSFATGQTAGLSGWQLAMARISNTSRYTSEAGGTLYPNNGPFSVSDTNTVHLLDFQSANISGIDVHTASNTALKGAQDCLVRFSGVLSIANPGTNTCTFAGITFLSNGTAIDMELATNTDFFQCGISGGMGADLVNNCFYPRFLSCTWGGASLSANFGYIINGINTTGTYVQPTAGNSVTIPINSTGSMVGHRIQTNGGEYIITSIPDGSHVVGLRPPESLRQNIKDGGTVPSVSISRIGFANRSDCCGNGLRLREASAVYVIDNPQMAGSGLGWGFILGYSSNSGKISNLLINVINGHGGIFSQGGTPTFDNVQLANEGGFCDYAQAVFDGVASWSWVGPASGTSLQTGPTGIGILLDAVTGMQRSECDHGGAATAGDQFIYMCVPSAPCTYPVVQVNPLQVQFAAQQQWSDGTVDVVVEPLERGGESDWNVTSAQGAASLITCNWGPQQSPIGPDFSCQRIVVTDTGTHLTGTTQLVLPTAFENHYRYIFNGTGQTLKVWTGTGAFVNCAGSNATTPIRSTGTGWVQNGASF